MLLWRPPLLPTTNFHAALSLRPAEEMKEQNAAERSLCHGPPVQSRENALRASCYNQRAGVTLPFGNGDTQKLICSSPVPVKRITTTVFAAPRLSPTYVDIPVPIYVPRYVEVPVPVAKLDSQTAQPPQ